MDSRSRTPAPQPARVLILTGPSGSGKTTVGTRLAARLGWPFYDGDDYQPKANIDKMAQGLALNDQDRLPWLRALHDLIAGVLSGRGHGVVACSALKQGYRDILRGDLGGIGMVYFKASLALLEARLKSRSGHFFKSDLLPTQFEILEEPSEALTLDASLDVEVLAAAICRHFRLPAREEAGTRNPASRSPDRP